MRETSSKFPAQKTRDKEHFLPVVVCAGCGEETPLTYRLTMVKGDKKISIWSTPCCDLVSWDGSNIIGYISEQDLLDMGYTKKNLTTKDARKLQEKYAGRTATK